MRNQAFTVGVGKHLGLSAIEQHFAWVFDDIPREQFVVFGVIRDPVEFLVSLYNSHLDPQFVSRPDLFTGYMSFEEFINEWVPANKGQAAPQSERFIDKSGGFGMNFVACYNNLDRHLAEIAKGIGMPMPALGRINVSPIGLDASQVASNTLDLVKADYAMDYAVIGRLSGPLADRCWQEDAPAAVTRITAQRKVAGGGDK